MDKSRIFAFVKQLNLNLIMKHLFSLKALFVAVAVMVMGAMSVNAQELRWGAVAGLNVSKYALSGTDNRAGFHLGAKAELGLPEVTNGLYLDFQALISMKGAKVDDLKFNPVYLEIPVHVGYKYAFSDKVAVFGNFGPYIAIGLGGKIKYDDESVKYFGDDGYDRFDFGLGLKVGAEFNQKIQVSLGYDWGLLEGASDTEDMKNRNLMISVGYMF